MILGKVAQRQREEEEEAAQAQMTEKDPFNLSNDEFYLPKGSSTVSTFGGSMIQVKTKEKLTFSFSREKNFLRF